MSKMKAPNGRSHGAAGSAIHDQSGEVASMMLLMCNCKKFPSFSLKYDDPECI